MKTVRLHVYVLNTIYNPIMLKILNVICKSYVIYGTIVLHIYKHQWFE